MQAIRCFGEYAVAADDALLENNTALVGGLNRASTSPDTMITPFQVGPMEILVSVNFTDDFNQLRTFETTLLIDVVEMDGGDFYPGGDPFSPQDGFEDWEPQAVEETFWQKLLRVLKGLLGLDSGVRTEPVFFEDAMTPSNLP